MAYPVLERERKKKRKNRNKRHVAHMTVGKVYHNHYYRHHYVCSKNKMSSIITTASNWAMISMCVFNLLTKHHIVMNIIVQTFVEKVTI